MCLCLYESVIFKSINPTRGHYCLCPSPIFHPITALLCIYSNVIMLGTHKTNTHIHTHTDTDTKRLYCGLLSKSSVCFLFVFFSFNFQIEFFSFLSLLSFASAIRSFAADLTTDFGCRVKYYDAVRNCSCTG